MSFAKIKAIGTSMMLSVALVLIIGAILPSNLFTLLAGVCFSVVTVLATCIYVFDENGENLSLKSCWNTSVILGSIAIGFGGFNPGTTFPAACILLAWTLSSTASKGPCIAT